jgi:hypothetical protein
MSRTIRDVFLDAGLRDMGFAPRDGMTGKELLVQMCQQCHHSSLDLTITRELFLTDMPMSRAEKDIAIERILLPVESRLSMPPALFRTVTDAERKLMIEERRARAAPRGRLPLRLPELAGGGARPRQ